MSPKSLLVTSLGAFAVLVIGAQTIGAHGVNTSGLVPSTAVSPSVSADAPLPGDSFRITFHNDGQAPFVQGVTTDPKTGERYWSGPQDPMLPPNKSFEEHIGEYLDKESVQEIKIFAFEQAGASEPGKLKTMNPPWNTHCHRTIYIPNPVIVHC